jgi:glycosyltransferase involved in cell wall biosynthesis
MVEIKNGLRVLHVILSGGYGGIEAHVEILAAQQQEAGLEPQVVCCFRGGPATRKISESGIPVHECLCSSGHDIRLLFRLVGVIKSVRPDVVHFHSAPLLGVFAALYFFGKVVVTHHLVPIRPSDRLVCCAYAIPRPLEIAVSRSTKEFVEKACRIIPRRVFLIYNGIDLSRHYSHERHFDSLGGPKILTTVGRLEKDKCTGEAINVLHTLRSQGLNVRLWVVGDGSELPALRERACLMGLGPFVTFWGWQGDTARFYRRSHIALLLSEAETFGISALEALANGIPLLAYPMNGGINEWIGKSGGAIVSRKRSANDIACLAKAILEEPERWRNMRLEARRTAEPFSAKRMAVEVSKIYDRLLATES